MVNQKQIINVLRTIEDPTIKEGSNGRINVYDLGLIHEIIINKDSYVKIIMTLTSAVNSSIKIMDSIGEAVNNMEQVRGVKIDLTFRPEWDPTCILQKGLKILGKKHPLYIEAERLRSLKDISITDEAKNKLLDLLEEEGYNEDDYVRVYVTSGGCSGLSYNLDFANEADKEEACYEDNGIKILINKQSYPYIHGTTLEYSGGLNGRGFVFNNPNATKTCGCGDSFSA